MSPTVISAADLAAYSPANHTGTSNVRVIGPETVGATALEVLVGTIVKSHGAKPHAHPYLEQCAYMIEGTGESQAQGRVEALGPGSWSYVPAGVFHSFRVTSDQPGRLLVVYAPPYGENPAQTITEPDPAFACTRRRPRARRPATLPRQGWSRSSTARRSARAGSRSTRCAWPAAMRSRAPPGRMPSRCSSSKTDNSTQARPGRTSSSRRATSCFSHAGPPRPCAARRAGGRPASSSRDGSRPLLHRLKRNYP